MSNNMDYRKKLLNLLYGRKFIHETVMYNLSEPVLIFPYKPYNRVSDCFPNPTKMCILHCSNSDCIVIGRYSLNGEFLYGESSITLKDLGLKVDGWRYL